MSQIDTPTPDPNLSDPPKDGQLPPVDKQNAKKLEFTRARIFLFIALPTLILLFNANTIVISIITTMLILLSIGHMFDPISNSVLKYSDALLIVLSKPFERLWRFLFVKHLAALGRWLKLHRRPVIDAVAIIAILTLLGTTTLHPSFATWLGNLNDSACLNTPLPWPTCASGLGISTLPNYVRIGLITNNAEGTFDQSTLNQNETQLENDIFGENQQCTGQHITLVAVTMLSRTVESPLSGAKIGWQDLQGSYLAQRDYNTTHPAFCIRLAIANLGTEDTADEGSLLVKSHPDDYSLPQVIHQIAQFAHTDPSFSGIVGFPFSAQATEALNLIKGYPDLSTIPIISPSASSDELANIPNFYRITSPNHSQGAALAQFFCDRLQSQSSDSIAMLTDSNDPYSSDLQLAFNDAVKCGNPMHRTTISFTKGKTDKIQGAIDQALLQQHAKFILFTGYDQDMDTVELEIHRILQDHASDITIMGGGGINIVDPTTHYSYTRVYATSSTGPFPDTDASAKRFIQAGISTPPFVNAIPSHLWIPTDALLAYDAVNAFAQTANKVQSGDFTQSSFNENLASINFKGVSGEIVFQGNRDNRNISNRDQGYIYITCNDLAHNVHLITEYSTINDGYSPAQNLPLSPADGASPCSG